MFESNYIKIYAGSFIIAQLIFDKLDEIGINPILKDDNLGKVKYTLEMQKKLTGKGKKRKMIDENGNVTYKWFGERKK